MVQSDCITELLSIPHNTQYDTNSEYEDIQTQTMVQSDCITELLTQYDTNRNSEYEDIQTQTTLRKLSIAKS